MDWVSKVPGGKPVVNRPASSPAVRSESCSPQVLFRRAWPHTVSWARGRRGNTGSLALRGRAGDRGRIRRPRGVPPASSRRQRGSSEATRAGEPKAPRDRLGERALLDAEPRRLELSAVAKQGVQQTTQAASDRDDGDLVSAPRTQLGEVRVERMGRAVGVMRGLAEHRAEFGRPALGDVPVPVRRPGLIRSARARRSWPRARRRQGDARRALGPMSSSSHGSRAFTAYLAVPTACRGFMQSSRHRASASAANGSRGRCAPPICRASVGASSL